VLCGWVIFKDAGGFFDKSWRGRCIDLCQRIATRYRLGFLPIDKVFASGSMTTLGKYKFTFEQLRHGIAPDTGDDERDF
jgi:hypothetical protein